MKKTQKPGDMFNKFQKKKKSYSESDMGSMKGYKPLNTSKPVKGLVDESSAVSGSPLVGNVNRMRAKKKPAKHKKNWIAKAIKKPGALHAELGVKKGNKIPAKTLAKAAKKGGKEGKRARLAETLKSLNHKHKKSDMKHCKTCSC